MATQSVETPAEVSAKEAALKAAQEKAKTENAKRTGKGTRIAVGQTRGRNTQVVSWEHFDESQPETLPGDTSEFLKLAQPYVNVADDKVLVSLLIDGFNSQAYQTASDPIAEYVNPVWPDEIQKNFRIAVRNYATATGTSMEDAATLIKPGIDKVHGKTS